MKFDCSKNNSCIDIIVRYLPNFIYKIIFGHKMIKNTIELDSAKVESKVKTKTVYVQTDELRDINHLEDFNSVSDEVVENYVNKNMANDLIRAENDNNDNVEEKRLQASVVDNEKVRFNSRITSTYCHQQMSNQLLFVSKY